jgi:hypothetical protein
LSKTYCGVEGVEGVEAVEWVEVIQNYLDFIKIKSLKFSLSTTIPWAE